MAKWPLSPNSTFWHSGYRTELGHFHPTAHSGYRTELGHFHPTALLWLKITLGHIHPTGQYCCQNDRFAYWNVTFSSKVLFSTQICTWPLSSTDPPVSYYRAIIMMSLFTSWRTSTCVVQRDLIPRHKLVLFPGGKSLGERNAYFDTWWLHTVHVLLWPD